MDVRLSEGAEGKLCAADCPLDRFTERDVPVYDLWLDRLDGGDNVWVFLPFWPGVGSAEELPCWLVRIGFRTHPASKYALSTAFTICCSIVLAGSLL
jgi:hypothetical protein